MPAADTLKVLPASTEAYRIVYQDEHLLVVNKPAMLLTVPGRHPDNQDCLIHRLQQEFPTAAVVHRLDYDTSGLLIIPLHKAALSAISKQFQARTIQKHYLAVVSGQLTPAAGRIDLAIAPDAERRPRYKICPDGKPSVTEYQVLSYDPQSNCSRVQLSPVTGRSHQLRLHMMALGHPIVGDPFYAPAASVAKSTRLLLHAGWIRFLHPVALNELECRSDAAF
ncbi:MAG: RluA family pseudouridine synthase [Alkalimonas sp.]|nr:RluA family pseudouridine synthase [Alkalimonas sp.]